MRKVMRIFAKTPVALAAFIEQKREENYSTKEKSFSENFFHMCLEKFQIEIVKAFDVLMLYAEHSFNVSTLLQELLHSLSDIHELQEKS